MSIGGLVVMEGDTLASIFFERDYARKVISGGGHPGKRPSASHPGKRPSAS